MTLHVLAAGPLVTVQDFGRAQFERFGVPPSGAMDWYALRAANRLLGNEPGAAALEFILEPPVLWAQEECLVAVTGRGYALSVGGRAVGAWRCTRVRPGERIKVIAEADTGWGYLAVSGGFDLPVVMGSQSTYLRGGFGGVDGRCLQRGDVLPVGRRDLTRQWRFAGRALAERFRPRYGDRLSIPVIAGPQDEVFGTEGRAVFAGSEYVITASSDRMGYRLSGPAVPRVTGGELLSEGIAAGSIQVPPDGQPIVLLSDRPATGGYAKIGTVARAGLPLLVQARPGFGRLRFEWVDVEAAQQQYRTLIDGIEKGVLADDDYD